MASYKDIFQIKKNNLHPSQGNILISDPLIQDAYFIRSVVLLVEHDEAGTTGFMLNKRSNLCVNNFFDQLADVSPIPIFIGGPVSPDHLYFIHSIKDVASSDSIRINEQLYFEGDFNTLLEYICHGYPIEDKVKFFLGYAGWNKGQLADEISQNAWTVSDLLPKHLLSGHGDEFWKESVGLLGKEYQIWNRYPKDPNMN